MNILLIGASGAGKTTIGKALAEKIGFSWVDTDRIIEQKYGKITTIFELHGEAYFRELEKESVKEVCQRTKLVISTGGGTTIDEENAVFLKSTGKALYLKAKEETLVSRLKGCQDRPLLLGDDKRESFLRLLKKRLPIYEKQADFILETDGFSIAETLEKAIEILQENKVI